MTLPAARLALAVLFAVTGSALAAPPEPAEVVEEILELRRSAAGDGPEALRATDKELAHAIERLARESRRQAGEERPSRPNLPPRGRPVANRPAGDHRLLLRETAFRLDTLAHELEMRELYGQADGLRQMACRLRLDARGGAAPLPASAPTSNYPPGGPQPVLHSGSAPPVDARRPDRSNGGFRGGDRPAPLFFPSQQRKPDSGEPGPKPRGPEPQDQPRPVFERPAP